jgi:fructokinase
MRRSTSRGHRREAGVTGSRRRASWIPSGLRSGDQRSAGDAQAPPRVRLAIIGDVSRGELDDGSDAPVGSALNVTRHVRAMGLEPLLVTRVGDDAGGRRVVDILQGIGADTSGVQLDPERPTWAGEDGAGAAWDRLDPDAAARVIEATAPPLAFQTTTASRSEGARASLRSIRSATGVPFFVDVDLGQPWMRPDNLGPVLLGARWLRVPAEQLGALAPETLVVDEEPEIAAAQAVRQTFALESVVVEQHGIPVTVVSSRRVSRGRRPAGDLGSRYPVIRDAAAAGLAAGLARGWSESALLTRTVKLVRLLTEAGPPERLDPLFRDASRSGHDGVTDEVPNR